MPCQVRFNEIHSDWVIFPVHGTDGGICTCGKRACISPGKHPAPGGYDFLSVACPRDEAREKWSKHRGNWGVIPGQSGFVGIDVDVKDGKRGQESFARLEAEYGKLPDTLVVKTPSGGWHILCQRPDGAVITNSNGTIANGIDIRGDNGYLLTPGSVIFGKKYTVFKDDPIAPLPEGWIHLLRPQKNKETISTLLPAIGFNSRNLDYPSPSEADFALAGKMKASDYNFEQFCAEVACLRGHDQKSRNNQYLKRTWDNVCASNQDNGEVDLVGVEYVSPGEYLWRCTEWRKITPFNKSAFRFDGEIVGGRSDGVTLSLFVAAPDKATGATKLAGLWRVAGDGTTTFKAKHFVGKIYKVVVADIGDAGRSKVDNIISLAVNDTVHDDGLDLLVEPMRSECNNRTISSHSSPTLHSTQR